MVRCLRYSSGSSALQKFPAEKSVPRLEMRTLSMKPWPNGDPNISQLEPSFQLGWNWVSFGHSVGSLELAGVGRVGLNLIKLRLSPNSSQVFHRLATSANSRQVVSTLLGFGFVVVCLLVWVFFFLQGFLVPLCHPLVQV